MMKRNIILSICAFLIATLPANAKRNDTDYERHPYNFIGIQGGTQLTFTDATYSKLITPIGGISIGRFFSPVIGTRLNVQGVTSKGAYKVNGNDNIYSFKYATTNLDLLLNITNIIKPSNHWICNVNLVGGVGMSTAWDGNEMNATLGALKKKSAWRDDIMMTRNLRVGIQAECNVAKHWAINLEVDANNMGDRFNGKLTNSPDWQVTAMLGVNYKWGFKKKKQSSIYDDAGLGEGLDGMGNSSASEATMPTAEERAQKEEQPVVEESKPVEKAKEKLNVEIFFELASNTPNQAEEAKLAQLAKWMKDHPNSKVLLTSYADKKTGNARINLQISKERSEKVRNLLVNKYGVQNSRIKTEHKGDTAQPYTENDKNRVTVAIAEEQ